jgi:CBS domain-containing protein
VSGSTSIDAIRGLMKLEPGRTFFVTEEGSLIGVIAFSDLVQAALDPASAADLTARDIASPNPLFLVMNENLENALKVLERVPEDDVPVVRDPQTLEVVCLVRHHDVLTVFNQALPDVQAEEHNER